MGAAPQSLGPRRTHEGDRRAFLSPDRCCKDSAAGAKLLPQNSTAFFVEKFAALLRHICQRVPVRVSNSHMSATAWA